MEPNFRDYREHIQRVVDAILLEADPRQIVAEAIRAHPPRSTSPGVIAIGKAAAGMYEGWVETFGAPQQAVVVVPRDVHAPDWAIRAEHPIPGPGSLQAGRSVTDFIQRTRPACDGFVVLLSGGASALLASPAPSLVLGDLVAMTTALLRAGVPIVEFNRVRKHIETLKGGRMAALMSPQPVDCYMLSDVPDEASDAIGSGPVLPDGSTFASALEVLRRHDVDVPSVRHFLEEGAAGRHPETPKHGDACFRSVRAVVVGSNADVVQAAGSTLEHLGYQNSSHERHDQLSGDAAQCGRLLARTARELPAVRPASIVWGGETTVRVGRAGGVGGRNQELALAAAIELDGHPSIAVFSLATDGVDGPTDAAGAVVTGETCRLARALSLDPLDFLTRHDSFTFFEKLDRAGFPHLIRTGPTGTNLNDIAVAIVA